MTTDTTDPGGQKADLGARECWACKTSLAVQAQRCATCGSFQGWRRWIGETNAIALIALLGTVIGILVGVQRMRETDAAIAVVANAVDSLKLAERYREELHSLGPSKQRLSRLLALYEFNKEPIASEEEAKLFIAFLRPLGMSYRGHGSVSGTFGDPRQPANRNEVTVWINSYEKPNTFGFRYGLADGSYFRCNDSYFEVAKQTDGSVIFHEPVNFAPCAGR
jgi:hypothetical protein